MDIKDIPQEQKDKVKKQILDFLDKHEAIWKEAGHKSRLEALRWFAAIGDAEHLVQENIRSIAENIIDRQPHSKYGGRSYRVRHVLGR